ncbi:MAG: hypothetical protein WC197_03040 [Candidatus Gastranaerophilaceae bacterium]|jgi:hypothetical protein
MLINYKKFLTILFIIYFASFSFAVFASAKFKLVYFSANWNYTSRKGEDVIKKSLKELGNNIEFQEIDVDSITTSSAASELGLKIPNKIPYYILLKGKNEILLQNSYNGEEIEQMKQLFQNAISNSNSKK